MDVRARATLINIVPVPRSLQGNFSRLPWEVMVRSGIHTLDRAQDLKILKFKKKKNCTGLPPCSPPTSCVALDEKWNLSDPC